MKIRLPAELRDKIAAAAKDSQRTLNAEVVARLEASFAKARIPPLHDIAFTKEATSELAGEVARLVLVELKRPGDLQIRPGKPQADRRKRGEERSD